MHGAAFAQNATTSIPEVPLSALLPPMPGEPIPPPAQMAEYRRLAEAGDRMAMLRL